MSWSPGGLKGWVVTSPGHNKHFFVVVDFCFFFHGLSPAQKTIGVLLGCTSSRTFHNQELYVCLGRKKGPRYYSLTLLPGERALKTMKRLRFTVCVIVRRQWGCSFSQHIISADSGQHLSLVSLVSGLGLPFLTFGAPELLLVGVSCARWDV